MKAIMLAAGEGNRMRPLTYTRPKAMLPVANRPILEHLLIAASRAGISEFIIVTGYHDEQVRDYFGGGEKWGVSIEYATQRRQLGTADAIRMAWGLVDDSFLVMNGDVIVNQADISRLASRDATTMSVFRVKDTRDLGVVEVSADRVVRVHEKTARPPSSLANAGVYLFTPEIFDIIARTPKSPRGEYEITDSLQLMLDSGQAVAYYELGYWLDLSYPWDLLPANEALLAVIESENSGEIEDNVVVKGPVRIGQNTVVRSGSYLVGPVVIGADCEIGPNCYLRPGTAIGNGCHIGSAVEVKNSIIMSGSKIPHHNYVGDSVIGADCNLGAGTKIANLRLDKKDIMVGNINTRLRKLGAVIGDHVETGINVSINVGSMIGNNTHIGPGVVVSGIIAPESRLL
ncbi:MAG: sugar phosphate nucleotidyltransferase [Chloroflexota bacterium]|nr:sugar phosphate nucleotidyltransferase [Chloroflexota bacterium]